MERQRFKRHWVSAKARQLFFERALGPEIVDEFAAEVLVGLRVFVGEEGRGRSESVANGVAGGAFFTFGSARTGGQQCVRPVGFDLDCGG